jgi:hypothetical protein
MSRKHEALATHDIVLIHIDSKPAFFARVEGINPDYKPRWWHVKFFVFALPLQVITWIIDDEQIRGADFTMGGIPVRIEKVVPPAELPSEESILQREPVIGANQTPDPTRLAPAKQARILSIGKKLSE